MEEMPKKAENEEYYIPFVIVDDKLDVPIKGYSIMCENCKKQGKCFRQMFYVGCPDCEPIKEEE